MTTKKTMVKLEIVPYLNLFDLNKAWLDLKNQRTDLVEEASKLRAKGWALTHEINEIEEKISQAIVKLEKNNV